MHKSDIADISLPPSSSITSPISTSTSQPNYSLYAIAGCLSGVFMETLVHPLDTVRTRIKANSKEFMPFGRQARMMYAKEGPLTFMKGYTCTLVGSSGNNLIYFYIYERMKGYFKEKDIVNRNVYPFICSFFAGIVGDLIYIPCDLTRTRMQLEPGTYDYKNVFDGIKKIRKYEGFRNLYAGGSIFFTLDALHTSFTFGFYEMLHRTLTPYFDVKKGEVNLPLSMISSVIAAGLSASLTNPLDVMLTRVQMVNSAKKERGTIPNLVRKMYKYEGVGGFFKGVTGRLTYYCIAATILFPTYEMTKNLFGIDFYNDY